jgi:FKBP-type peptidyl-prolyl cis-trans isomerase 2
MAQAKTGDTVKVHYTGKLEDGTVFDTSTNRDPLQFTIGEQQVIPGLEQAVIGMEQGESKTAEIPAEQAYGPHRKELILEVERSQFPADLEPQVDQCLQLCQPDGQNMVVRVTEVSGSKVTLDANHLLAGKALTFDIQLVEIV